MRNLTMLTDLYQLTMMYGYYKTGNRYNRATFDMFYRNKVESTHYAIMAGVEQLIDYIKNLHFGEEDIDYLRSLGIFDEDFLAELSRFEFHGDIYAVPEGTIVFPYEPLIRVTAPIFEAQLIETALLNIINHQTLIATKASRVVQAAGGGVMEESACAVPRDRTQASMALVPPSSAVATAPATCSPVKCTASP